MNNFCEISGCNRKVKSRKLCLKHYKQKHYQRGEQDRLYDIWRQMVLRCYDKNHTGYINYGDRGIAICPRWLVGLPNIKPHKLFIADMGPRPEGKFSLERKDNEGNYEPDNCLWATKIEQARNTRANLLLT